MISNFISGKMVTWSLSEVFAAIRIMPFQLQGTVRVFQTKSYCGAKAMFQRQHVFTFYENTVPALC